MKRFLLAILLALCTISTHSQVDTCYDCRPDSIIDKGTTHMMKSAACGTPWLTTGNPPWTNYWAGFMINIINTNACPITITQFEAEFQGNTGYRIYTKTGTFIGFEANAAAWTTVGTIGGGLNGAGAGVMTPIPIAVNVTIPPGGTQAFYLTRTSNNTTRRHLYIAGSGTAGTTVYASNADISITEAKYIDLYFVDIAPTATRRPSIDVCYTINCPLPIELINFEVNKEVGGNLATWSSASEANNSHYTIERSTDGKEWKIIGTVTGAGNSNTELSYYFVDENYVKNSINYYKLSQTDFDGQSEEFDIKAVDNRVKEKDLVKIVNTLGQVVSKDYVGLKIFLYSDGSIIKRF